MRAPGSSALRCHRARRTNPRTLALRKGPDIHGEHGNRRLQCNPNAGYERRDGQHATTYSPGAGALAMGSSSSSPARHERVATFCHDVVPSLNSCSHFCIVPERALHADVCQAVIRLHVFFFFNENSDNFGCSPNKYLHTT